MGAWGLGPFENDGALEPLAQLREEEDDAVGAAFRAVMAEPDYVEVDAGQGAVAAAEILASAYGRPGDELPEEVARIVALYRERLLGEVELVEQARQALARLTAEGSEIAELSDEAGHGPEWRSRIADLDRRLSGIRDF